MIIEILIGVVVGFIPGFLVLLKARRDTRHLEEVLRFLPHLLDLRAKEEQTLRNLKGEVLVLRRECDDLRAKKALGGIPNISEFQMWRDRAEKAEMQLRRSPPSPPYGKEEREPHPDSYLAYQKLFEVAYRKVND